MTTTTTTYHAAQQMMTPAWDQFTAANPAMTPSQWEDGFTALMLNRGISDDHIGMFLGIGQ